MIKEIKKSKVRWEPTLNASKVLMDAVLWEWGLSYCSRNERQTPISCGEGET